MFVSPLFKESIRDTGGFSSVLLMAAIISKVTNAINMENSLLITQLALGLSSACFNLHNHSLDKQSFNHHTALPCDTQYSNQPIYRLSDWTLGYSEIPFTLPQWCNGQWRAFQWALNQSECNMKPQQYTCKCAVQFDFVWSRATDKHTGNSQQHMFALSAQADNKYQWQLQIWKYANRHSQKLNAITRLAATSRHLYNTTP